MAGGGGEGKTEGGEKKQFFALLGDRSSYSYLFIVVESFIFHRTKDTYVLKRQIWLKLVNLRNQESRAHYPLETFLQFYQAISSMIL